MKKGMLINLILVLFNMILIVLPGSTYLFALSFESLNIQDMHLYIIDILGLLSLPIAYVLLRLFYKRRAIYIKTYPLVMLGIALMWTLAVQVK